MSANKNLQTLQNKLDDLSELTTLIREARDADVAELNAENDEINRKWAEDNERHTDVMAEQQEQIIRLEEENKKLKDCDIMQYSYLVQGENKLLKEWQDMKNELGWYAEHVEILEKQLDRRD